MVPQFYKRNLLTLTSECKETSAALFTSPSLWINSTVNYKLNGFRPYFRFDNFTFTNYICPIEQYLFFEYVEDSKDLEAKPITGWEVYSVSPWNQVYVKLPIDAINITKVYRFYIKAVARGGANMFANHKSGSYDIKFNVWRPKMIPAPEFPN